MFNLSKLWPEIQSRQKYNLVRNTIYQKYNPLIRD